MTELNFQTAQRTKREANEALTRGDHEGARRIWQDTRQRLSSVDRRRMDARERFDFDEEISMLDRIMDQAELDINQARKISSSDYHRKNRKRGRDSRG